MLKSKLSFFKACRIRIRSSIAVPNQYILNHNTSVKMKSGEIVPLTPPLLTKLLIIFFVLFFTFPVFNPWVPPPSLPLAETVPTVRVIVDCPCGPHPCPEGCLLK
jgi:hypothetical protein